MPRKSFWARLPFGVRMATAGLAVLALVAGSAAGIAALTSAESRVVTAAGQQSMAEVPAAEVPPRPPAGDSVLGAEATGHAAAEQAAGDDRSAPGEADRTATRGPRRAAPPDRRKAGRASAAAPARDESPSVPSTPAVRTELIAETEVIPFRTRLIRDPSLPRGSKRIQREGVPGERLLRYEVTYTGSTETSRRLLDATVTRRPQHRVVAFGNRRGGISQHSGGGQQSGGGRGQRRECRLTIESCVDMGRSAGCTGDPADPRPESIIDGDLSLLEPADLDELDLVLPCPDEPVG